MMSNKNQELKKRFFRDMGDALKSYGFKRKGDEYHKITEYGKDVISIQINTHKTILFDVDIYIFVRHNNVENLVTPYVKGMDEEDIKRSITLGGNVRYVLGLDCFWLLKREEDYKYVLDDIVQMLIDDAFPFFKEYSSLDEVKKVLSKDDSISMSLFAGSVGRAMRAVAITYLLGDIDEFDNIVNMKKQYLEENILNPMVEMLYPDFTTLVDDLKKRIV